MIVPVMAISNLVLTQQIYSEETNGAHAHYREPVPLRSLITFVPRSVVDVDPASSTRDLGTGVGL